MNENWKLNELISKSKKAIDKICYLVDSWKRDLERFGGLVKGWKESEWDNEWDRMEEIEKERKHERESFLYGVCAWRTGVWKHYINYKLFWLLSLLFFCFYCNTVAISNVDSFKYTSNFSQSPTKLSYICAPFTH